MSDGTAGCCLPSSLPGRGELLALNALFASPLLPSLSGKNIISQELVLVT